MGFDDVIKKEMQHQNYFAPATTISSKGI